MLGKIRNRESGDHVRLLLNISLVITCKLNLSLATNGRRDFATAKNQKKKQRATIWKETTQGKGLLLYFNIFIYLLISKHPTGFLR